MPRRTRVIKKNNTIDKNKLNVYTFARRLNFCPEVIILSGLIEKTPTPKNNEPDRFRNIISFCRERINYIDDPSKADIFVLPHKFKGINCGNYKKLVRLSNQYQKKLLCFYNDDDDKKHNINPNVILYRTSFYKSTKLDNELALNVLVPDNYDNTFQQDLSIGFCGTVFKKNRRQELLGYIKNSHLRNDLILRTENGNRWDFEHNYAQRRKEYFNNIRNNLFTICDRGYGNYSYRFYETMMMGRIPIIINTDCVFPFEEKIDIHDVGLVLESNQIKDKDSFIQSIEKYYEENKERLEEIQKNNRKIWEEYYSAEGFVDNLVKSIKDVKINTSSSHTKQNTAIFISSTPKFSFIWDTFFTFLRKHWKDCPYPVHFVSTGSNDYLKDQYNVNVEKLGKDLGFLEGYRYLCEKYKDKYSHFILLQDDFLIEKKVNQEIITKYEKIVYENQNIGFIRMMPSPGPKGNHKMFGDVKLARINKNEDYSFSYQSSLWNLDYFYDFTAPSRFRWDDFNMSKKMRIDKSGKENWGFIRPFKEWNAVYESPIPYRPTAILKGKLMDWAKPLIIPEKKIISYNSLSGQDRYVENILKFKKDGYFLEIGADHPEVMSNTYILEKKYNWRGIMIEWKKNRYSELKEQRPNSIPVITDGTTVDYKKLLLENNYPKNLDYLQVDLEATNGSTLKALQNLDKNVMDDYKFATVTFEHDIWHTNKYEIRKISREIFERRGYHLLFADVHNTKPEDVYEDWYVHPELVDMEHVNHIRKINESQYVTNKITGRSIKGKTILYQGNI